MKVGISSTLSAALLAVTASGAVPTVTAVVNGASFISGPIAPGELINISGSGFAISPTQSAGTVPLPKVLAGVAVMIDAVTLGLVTVTTTQIQAVAPAQLQPGSHQLVVTSGSVNSAPFAITGAADSPGIFTADSSGQGQALAFNSDGTSNSTSNPSTPGRDVTIYFTGAGQTDPPFTDNSLPSNARFVAIDSEGLGPSDPFAVSISTGLVPNRAGYDQVTIRLPLDLPPGAEPISLDLYTISGTASAQSGVNIAVGKGPLPLLSVQPSALSFASSSSKSPAQTISLSSSGSPIAFTLSAESGGTTSNWLSVSATSGTTPASIVITADPAGLEPGNYLGSLSLFYAAGSLSVDVQLTVTSPALALQSIITTVAGADFTFPNRPLAAVNAPTGPIFGVAKDLNGNLYASDSGNYLVLKVDTSGTLSVFAGNGIAGFSGDGGPATDASLSAPGRLAIDNNGNVYIADSGRIRQVSPSGAITSVAGLALAGNTVPSIDVDQAGNLYTTSIQGIQKRTPAGVVSIVPGSANLAPNAIAVDVAGNIYVTSGTPTGGGGDGVLYELTPGGTLLTLARSLYDPMGLRVDASGNVYIAEFLPNQPASNRIIKLASGVVTTVAGNGLVPLAGDNGPALNASMGPTDLALDDRGDIFIADNFNCRVRLVANGVISTVIGNGEFQSSGDSGPASSAALRAPKGVAIDSEGNMYIADSGNNRIRRVAPDGIITTIAGNGVADFRGDGGAAVAASLSNPGGVTVDVAGNLYIADTGNNRIRQVTPQGVISTVAGNGSSVFTPGFPSFQLSPGYTDPTFSGDGGPATSAPLSFPTAVAVDSSGDLFVAELFRIRKVTLDGKIATVAGSGPGNCPVTPFSAYCGSFSGDGGPATSAKLNGPNGVAVDSHGNMVIADTGNGVVREVSNNGLINTIVQTEFAVFDPHSPSIIRDSPSGVTLDQKGTIYYSDVFDLDQNLLDGQYLAGAKVGALTPSGSLITWAGGGAEGFAGDGGVATRAGLSNPTGVAVDSAGNLYIADSGNNRIREVLAGPPSVNLAPSQLQFSAPSGGAPTTTQTLNLTAAVDGLAFSVTMPIDATWVQVSPTNGAAPRLIQVVADPANLAPGTYRTTITVNTPNANPALSSVAVSFSVTAGQSPALAIATTNLSFPFSRHGSRRSQTILVSNSGGGKLNFAAAAITVTGSTWLSVSPTSGQAQPANPATLTVTADPSGLSPGTYAGKVTVNAGAQTKVIPVTMTISVQDQAILLSQTGLSFLGVSRGGVLPTQSFGVLNIGTGVVDWSLSTSTLPPGGNWLQATSSSHSTDASSGSVPTVQVSANAASLPPGQYYGLVRVDSPNAANTPQVLTVFVQVLAPDADIGAVLQPAELLFTATAGESPGSQNLLVYNVAAAPKSFQSTIVADTGLNLVTLPADATLDAQQPTSIVVQPFTTGLGVGVYNGVITLQFSDGRVVNANVRVIVSNASAPSSFTSSSEKHSARPADSGPGCTAMKLLPALTTLGPSFAVSAGWPVALGVVVLDNCGVALESGAATASFSNGDQSVVLTPTKGGHWEGTWTTSNKTQAQVTITLQAQNLQSTISGQRMVSGALLSSTDPPVFDQAGVVSAAGDQSFVALAPGSIITINGNRLAESTMRAPSVPLPIQLVDTEVFIAQKKLPLFSVGQGQINAIVPYELNVNTPQQVLVQRGLTYSQPVSVNVAPAQPAVIPNDVMDYPADKSPPYLVTDAKPASTGDTLVIYCGGLGLTMPGVVDGGAAPSNPPAQTLNSVQVTIGGSNATVVFAGLSPGSVGKYQVNAVVPSGVPSGNQPLVLKVSGQISSPVNLPIH